MRRSWPVLLGITAILLMSPAHAQTSDDLQRRDRERATQMERDQRQTEPRIHLQPTVPAPSGHIETIDEHCFDVDHVQLVVPGVVKQQWPATTNEFVRDKYAFLKDTITRYKGRCIGKTLMQNIISQLLARSLAEGYTTTRFYIPDQDLSKRIFKINIVPGFVHDVQVRMADGDGAAEVIDTQRNLARLAFPVNTGELLNVRDLEQGLEQVKRLPSVDIKMELVPTQNVVGGTDVVLHVSRVKSWSVNASVDNAGVEPTGVIVWRGGAILDNPLGIADQLSLGINTDNEDDKDVGRRGFDLQYSIPWGYWLLSLSGNDSEYSQLFGQFSQLVSSGTTRTYAARLTHVFYRDNNDKLEWYSKLEQREAHSFLNDVEIEIQQRNTLAGELGVRIKRYLGDAILDVVIASRWGLPWFGYQEDAPELTRDAPTFEYNLQTIDINFSTPFSALDFPLQFQSVVRGQWSESNLYGSEFFSIGSRYSVRGFGEEDTLQAEKGLYWRNEVSSPLWQSRHQLYLGVDAGKLGGPTTEFLVGDTLVGGFVGVRGGLYRVNYDLFSGWPIQQPDNFNVKGPSVGFSVSVYY